MMTTEQEAADALAGMRGARVRANRIKRLPFAYHLAFGAMMAGFVAAPALGPSRIGAAVAILILVSIGLYHWQRRATGRWLNGYRAGRTLPISILLALAMIGLLLVSHPGTLPTFNLLTPMQGALAAFVLSTALGWIWMKVYDAEQRAGR